VSTHGRGGVGMTILTESERVYTLERYKNGWSFQEIAQQILENRNKRIYYDVVREVGHVVSHRFSKKGGD
jgi:hypothetical protein